MRIRSVIALMMLASLFSAHTFSAVGRTPGQFQVSPTGSAQYTIPIWTPPGIRGIQPKLALVYDSQLSYGIMGPGWTLSGLSTIARCNATYAQDGTPAPITLTTADGLCMDGNRLRGVPAGSTTTYQTEIANFSQVTATAGTNGPSYFTVRGKDGLTYEYGNTTDSKVLPAGSSTPYLWALDKVTDRYGNQMTFTYYQSGGAYVPLSIQYTAPSGSTSFPYQVNFDYTTKSTADTLSRYIAGSQAQQTQQLSTITMTSSGTIVREYKLLYTTSTATLRATLTSLQECGGSAGTDCLSPTTVGYQYGTAGVPNPTTVTGAGTPVVDSVNTADFNGDGLADLIYATTNGSTYSWWVQLSTGTGFGAPISTGAVTSSLTTILLNDFAGGGNKQELLAPSGSVWYLYSWNGTSFSATATNASVDATATSFASANAHGNGLPDLFWMDGGTLYELPNTTSGTTISFATSPIAVYTGLASNERVSGALSAANSSVKHMDFDGDGREDLLAYDPAPRVPATLVLLSRGSGAFVPGPTLYGPVFPVNWNDDQCTDLTGHSGASSGIWEVYISACNGASASTIDGPNFVYAALDWDGDGRTDLIVNPNDNASTMEVYTSTGAGISSGASTSVSSAYSAWVVLDSNGDGLDDLIVVGNTTPLTISHALHSGSGVRPDLATSFVDGNGIAFDPTYQSLAQGSYGYGATDSQYPDMVYVGPLYVVNQFGASDGIGGTYTNTFHYYDGYMNVQGRGFLGFWWKQTADSRNGVYDMQYYIPTFPATGLLYNETQTNGTTFWTVTNTYATETLDGTTNNQRLFPYLSVSTDQVNEVGGTKNGDLITTKTISFGTPDAYGNFDTVTTSVTDNDTTSPASPYANETWTSTTVNTIAPQPAEWCLNLPTETTVTNAAPNEPAITRTVSYTPDYTHCVEGTVVIEPSSSLYKVTEVFGFDGFGNPNSEVVTGAGGMSPRSTSVSWGTTGQFPTTITNALSQSTTLAFDPNTGMQTSQTDPNGITTSWKYDDFARKVQETRPDGTYSTWVYYDCTQYGGCIYGPHALSVAHSVYASNGTVITGGSTYFDQLDRPLIANKELLAAGTFDRNEVRYDSLGRVSEQAAPCLWTSLTTPCPYWTTYYYDAINRLSYSQRPISSANSKLQTTNFGYAGRTSTIQDPLGNVTTKVTQVTGSLGRSQGANGYYQNFTYDSFGSLLSVTDSASPANTLFKATYGYGLGAFQTSSTDMDLGARTYTVDALGEVTAYKDAKSQSFSITYDALSRPMVRTDPEPSGSYVTTWNWGSSAASDNIGKLQSITATSSTFAGTWSDTYTYDSVGRPATETISNPGDRTYEYIASYDPKTGFLSSLQYPIDYTFDLTVQYAYSNGILQSISSNSYSPTIVFWTANATNPRGQVTTETYGNGAVKTSAYDAVTGWLGSIQAGVGGGSVLQNKSFSYDYDGNLTQRQDNNLGLTENFYLDPMNRLDHSTLNGTINLQMTYDTTGMGNIAARSDIASGTAWTYDPVRKHAVTQAGSSANTYAYDANGNMTNRNGYTIPWTSYNYPLSVSSAGESVSFAYDGNRQRWQEIYTGGPNGTETTYHAGKLFEVTYYGGQAWFRHYVYAGNELVAVDDRSYSGEYQFYLVSDHQGSLAAIESGSNPGINDVFESFTAFGNRRNGNTWSGPPSTEDTDAIGTVTRRGYTGETTLGVSMGLNHLNGRVEDSITGRFLSPDPYVPNPGNTQSFNRYSYVNNNPLSFTDPSGFDETGLPEYIVTAGGGPANPYTDVLAGAVEILSDLGLSGLFGGGGAPHLSAAQQSFVNHGGNLQAPLPSIQVTAPSIAGGQLSIDNAIAGASVALGASPALTNVIGQSSVPASAPDQIDGVQVTARAIPAFDPGLLWLPGLSLPASMAQSKFSIFRGKPPGAVACTAYGIPFMAPPGFNLGKITAAGQAGGWSPSAMNSAVGHYGSFDFQRSTDASGNTTFYTQYQVVSNVAVGSYLYGTGIPEILSNAIEDIFAVSMSSNSGDSNQFLGQEAGWDAASGQASISCGGASP